MPVLEPPHLSPFLGGPANPGTPNSCASPGKVFRNSGVFVSRMQERVPSSPLLWLLGRWGRKRQDVREPLSHPVTPEPSGSLASLDLGYDFLASLKSHCRYLDFMTHYGTGCVLSTNRLFQWFFNNGELPGSLPFTPAVGSQSLAGTPRLRWTVYLEPRQEVPGDPCRAFSGCGGRGPAHVSPTHIFSTLSQAREVGLLSLFYR